MPAYIVITQTTYKVDAEDSLSAQFAAVGVANGCQTDADELHTPRTLMQCTVEAKETKLVLTAEQDTDAEPDKQS